MVSSNHAMVAPHVVSSNFHKDTETQQMAEEQLSDAAEGFSFPVKIGYISLFSLVRQGTHGQVWSSSTCELEANEDCHLLFPPLLTARKPGLAVWRRNFILVPKPRLWAAVTVWRGRT